MPTGAMSWCVKLNWISFIRMPRNRSKCMALKLAPMKNRPLPSVWARSPKIGPPDVAVLTGSPPTNWYVTPLEVAPTGVFDTLAASELPRRSRLSPAALCVAGMMCEPWPASASARHNGWPQSPNVNRSERICSRSVGRASGGAAARNKAKSKERRTGRPKEMGDAMIAAALRDSQPLPVDHPPKAQPVAVAVFDVEVAAAILLVADVPRDLHTLRLELRMERIGVIDPDVCVPCATLRVNGVVGTRDTTLFELRQPDDHAGALAHAPTRRLAPEALVVEAQRVAVVARGPNHVVHDEVRCNAPAGGHGIHRVNVVPPSFIQSMIAAQGLPINSGRVTPGCGNASTANTSSSCTWSSVFCGPSPFDHSCMRHGVCSALVGLGFMIGVRPRLASFPQS